MIFNGARKASGLENTCVLPEGEECGELGEDDFRDAERDSAILVRAETACISGRGVAGRGWRVRWLSFGVGQSAGGNGHCTANVVEDFYPS